MLKTYFPNFRKLVAPITRPESERLLLVIHHLVVDLVSWQVLLEDLESLGENRIEIAFSMRLYTATSKGKVYSF